MVFEPGESENPKVKVTVPFTSGQVIQHVELMVTEPVGTGSPVGPVTVMVTGKLVLTEAEGRISFTVGLIEPEEFTSI